MSYIKTKHIFETPSPTDFSLFTLKAWVSSTSNNIPSSVFLYYKDPAVPYDILIQDKFRSVCTYADMLNYPEAAPSGTSRFFRLPYIYVEDVSLYTLDTVWDTILEDLDILINDIVVTNSSSDVSINSYSEGCV